MSSILFANLQYLTRVFLGLALVALWMIGVIWIPKTILSPQFQLLLMFILLLPALALPLVVARFARKADALRQSIHQLASTRSLPWIATSCAVAGLLQANDFIPDFNQLWMFLIIVAIWGLQLMLADRPHH